MTEIGTSWMFCSRFCAVTIISFSAGWLAACCARLESAAMTPQIANTRATPCRKGTRRLVIQFPLKPVPFLGAEKPRGPTLWADRHNSSVRSLREGSSSDLASGVNLLTLGAILDRGDAPAR